MGPQSWYHVVHACGTGMSEEWLKNMGGALGLVFLGVDDKEDLKCIWSTNNGGDNMPLMLKNLTPI